MAAIEPVDYLIVEPVATAKSLLNPQVSAIGDIFNLDSISAATYVFAGAMNMKRCSVCLQIYSDDMKFCRSDGTLLETLDNVPTEILANRRPSSTQLASAETTVLNESSKPLAAARITGDLTPETKYAKSGDINVAYQVLGNGPIDLIYVPGWVSNLEYGWEEPSLAKFYHRLASFSRLILFDKRG